MTIKNKKILAIIPCRSGSEGVKNKNIKKIFNKPLIYYSIKFAQNCKFIDKIILSTDSKKYKSISENYGLKVPFLRPKNISKKYSLDYHYITHVIQKIKKEDYYPDYIIILRPTSPLRKIKELKSCLNKLEKNKNFDSLRSITKIDKSLYKTWYYENQKKIKPILKNDTNLKEPYDAPRQLLKSFYVHNGTYDIYKVNSGKKKFIQNKNIYGYEMKNYIDIDNLNDFKFNKKDRQGLLNFKKYISS